MGILAIIAVCIVLPQMILAGIDERPNIIYRLVYGGFGNPMQGLAEIIVGGVEYSICAQGWGDEDARVFCGLVGYPGDGAVATKGDVFERPGVFPYFMSRVRCTGSESDIRDCRHTPADRINFSTCTPDYRAGVICEGSPFLHPPVRIIGGANDFEGQVEIGLGSGFGKVCDFRWTDEDAEVVCRELGLTGGRAIEGGFFEPHHPELSFVWDSVRCYGSEESVFACRVRHITDGRCVVGMEAGVICDESEHPIRLYNGDNFDDGNMYGQVEIKVGRSFSQVCDDRFGEDEARIVCDTLGYYGPAQVANGNAYGNRPNLAISYFKCRGHEDDFYLCYRPQKNDECQSGTAAGVICSHPDTSN